MPDLDLDALANQTLGIPTREPVQPVPPAFDLDAMASTMLRPEVAKPTKSTVDAAGKPKPGFVQPTENWSFGHQLVNGMALGYFPELTALGEKMFGPDAWSTGKGRSFSDLVKQAETVKKAWEEQNPGAAATGTIVGSLATTVPMMAAGQEYAVAPAAEAIATRLPWMRGAMDFLGGKSEGLLARIPSLAARGGLEGSIAGLLQSHLNPDVSPTKQMLTGAATGALVNPATNPVFSHFFGSNISDTAAKTARGLQAQGVDIRPGQLPGASPLLSRLDKWFSGGKNAEQGEAFNTALTKQAGLPSKTIDQDWVASNDERTGKIMNSIRSQYGIPAMEPALVSDLSALRQHALGNMSNESAKKASEMIAKLEGNVIGGMNGNQYQGIIQKGGLLDNYINSKDPDVANFANGPVKQALEDAWERSLPTDAKKAWDTARQHYRITRVIDDSMGAEGASKGEFTPKKLLRGVEARYGNVNNAGELGDLAKGGQFLGAGEARAPHKFTPVQIAGGVMGASAAGTGLGSYFSHHLPEMVGHMAANPAEAVGPLLIAGGAYGGTKLLNSAMNSPRYTNYLLDIAEGKRNPLLAGNNPAIPLASLLYNSQ